MGFGISKRWLLIASFVVPASVGWAQGTSPQVNFDKALNAQNNWYFSWGYSRQQYAPSDIHVSQPTLGNDFTLHKVKASDFPSDFKGTLKSIASLDFTSPQENVRIGKYLGPEKDFAVEFSLDHTKYNTDFGQSVRISGTKAGSPVSGNVTLTPTNFTYNLHNGLNHIMVNGVWFKDLYGPKNEPGHLQFVGRMGAGILLPHADNIIDGNQNDVGPKNVNVCCTAKNDWWQVLGWTAGVEWGVRYTVYKSIYLELTSKQAYGALRGVPVYKGSADQKIWMNEQVLSTGFLF